MTVIVLMLGFPGVLIYLAATSDPGPAEPAAEPYDPSCVVTSPTIGCVDEATYDAVVSSYSERESAGYDDDEGQDYQGRVR